MADSRPSEPISNPAMSCRSEVESPLSQRVLMLLHCPFRLEACAPRSWSWTLRITLVMATLITACLCMRWPHASALEHRFKQGASTAVHPFRVTDFTAEPLVFSKGGRALSYVMPVALPPYFELNVEVFSSLADLGRVRIAGHPLGNSKPSPDESDSLRSSLDALESWHLVRLIRAGQDLSLWVDGRPILGRLSPKATTEWLTFEPDPERATQFRNLDVKW